MKQVCFIIPKHDNKQKWYPTEVLERLEDLVIDTLSGFTKNDVVGQWKDGEVVYHDSNVEYRISVSESWLIWIEKFLQHTCELLGQECIYLQIGDGVTKFIYAKEPEEIKVSQSSESANIEELKRMIADSVTEAVMVGFKVVLLPRQFEELRQIMKEAEQRSKVVDVRHAARKHRSAESKEEVS